MRDTERFLPPRNPALRWLAEIGPELSPEIQSRLRSTFLLSRGPLVCGSLNSVAVALVAAHRSGEAAFLALALGDLILLGFRLLALRRTAASSGPVFATGLIWAGLQGAAIALVVASADQAMSLVVLASGLAAVGGIMGRNFAAPRYAMAQILLIDLSYKVSFSILHPELLPLILAQLVVFVLMILGVMRRHRDHAIRAIAAELESRRQSIVDPLTGLLNRRGLQDAYAAPTAAGSPSLLYLDLDGFKQVNDRLGHGAGDLLLREVGRRLACAAGPEAAVCRPGGDEFLILAPACGAAELADLGARIVAAVAEPVALGDGRAAEVGVSIGAALGRGAADGLAGLMAEADRALYAAKAAGKGRCVVHGGVALARTAGELRAFDDRRRPAAVTS